MRKKRFRLKLGQKINLIVLGIILSLAVVIGIVVVQQVTSGIKEIATEKARGDLNLGKSYLDAKFPGDWVIKDGSLFKGSVKINDNFDIVDELGEKTGDTVTIFQGDTRVATNVMMEGKRAVGTQVSQEVANKVLKEKKDFFGEANVVGHKYVSAYTPIMDKSGEVIGIFYVGAPQNIIDETIASFMKVFIIVLLVVIVFSSVIVYLFTRGLTKRLSTVSAAMDQAKEGDFTKEILDETGDELSHLGESYNAMKENLGSMFHRVIEISEKLTASSQELTAGAEQTTRATEQITSSIQEVVDGIESQAASVDESAKAVEEVTCGINNLVVNSTTISQSAQDTQGYGREGGELIEETVEQMKKIHRSVHSSSEKIQLLDERSKQIGDITSTISEIANQTNLLALNAAIEAARAGEHGRGFAVVAEEVQKLAVQSQQSSIQISELIRAIINDMRDTYESMEQVKADVTEGIGIVGKTEESFVKIQHAVEEMELQISAAAENAEQILAGAKVVSASVHGISDVTKKSATHTQTVSAATEEQLASMEEVLASANSLLQMAEDLQENTSKFKV
ncbi:methyl-accepting chemotaxis protein [Robertmurraya andreesenii]|uniref:Methyl-accepting chemotaxis protein n=1 Tax=Anoxybacillus andreesenii TaxID=1325932 RepID=A0ABT9UZE3_9BACL|nr:methyl-accepting chemotaxis protein [Robertmurraya andreesenii]MDQ0154054.1 methyl-accepting chemotaxis protein [Robertmurraya andreesenii]